MLDTLSYFWASYVGVLIGVIYLVSARRGTSVSRRVAASLYAPIAAVLFVAATFTEPEYWSLKGVPLFPLLQLVPLALLIVSLRRYTGPRWVHFVLVPLALVCWGWQVFWGYLGIHGG